MRFPEAEILVMARAPVPGEAKTRLIPALGAEGAALLHAALVKRLLSELSEAQLAPVTLCCTPDITHPFFQQCSALYNVQLQQQVGEGLGERLHHALITSLHGHRYAVVVGCDIPQLEAVDIENALSSLIAGEDAAISPAEDGGYALLALKEAEQGLFNGVEWGTSEVMSQTRERLARLGWHWHELRCLWDLDRPEDIPRLTALSLPPPIDKLVKRVLTQQRDYQTIHQ